MRRNAFGDYALRRCADDFAILYPYFWGDPDVMMFMSYPEPGPWLHPEISSTTEVPQAQFELARQRFNAMWKELGAAMDYYES